MAAEGRICYGAADLASIITLVYLLLIALMPYRALLTSEQRASIVVAASPLLVHVRSRLTRQLVRVDPIIDLVLLVRLEAGGLLMWLPRRHRFWHAYARRFPDLRTETVELLVGLEALVIVVVVATVSLHLCDRFFSNLIFKIIHSR